MPRTGAPAAPRPDACFRVNPITGEATAGSPARTIRTTNRRGCFRLRAGARLTSPMATRRSRRSGASGAGPDDRDCPGGAHGRRCSRGCLCPIGAARKGMLASIMVAASLEEEHGGSDGDTTARTRTEQPVDVNAALSLLVHLASGPLLAADGCQRDAAVVRVGEGAVWRRRARGRSQVASQLEVGAGFCFEPSVTNDLASTPRGQSAGRAGKQSRRARRSASCRDSSAAQPEHWTSAA